MWCITLNKGFDHNKQVFYRVNSVLLSLIFPGGLLCPSGRRVNKPRWEVWGAAAPHHKSPHRSLHSCKRTHIALSYFSMVLQNLSNRCFYRSWSACGPILWSVWSEGRRNTLEPAQRVPAFIIPQFGIINKPVRPGQVCPHYGWANWWSWLS